MPQPLFIDLDTRQSNNPALPNDTNWTLTGLTIPEGSISVDLQYVEFPNVFSSFRTGINDTIEIQFWNNGGSTTQTIDYVLPGGQYTLAQLVTELQTLFNATVPTSAWGSGSTHALQVATSSGYTTNTLTFSVPLADQDGRGFQFTNSSVSTAANALGVLSLVNLGNTYPQQENSLVGGMVNLSGPEALDIVSSTFGLFNYNSAGRTNVLKRVYLDVPFGTIFYYQATIETPSYGHVSNLNQIRLRVQTTDGHDVTFPQDSHILYGIKLVYSIE